jgi:hypothetical protein
MGTYRTEGFRKEEPGAGPRAMAITTEAGGERDAITTIPTENCRERDRDGKEE